MRLNEWKTQVATGVVDQLPLITLDDAILLSDSYLSSNGGWVPTDSADPLGEGAPANNLSVADVVDSIVNDQVAGNYVIDGEVTVRLRIPVFVSASAGQTDSSVRDIALSDIIASLDSALSNSVLKRLSVDNISGSVKSGGTLTNAERVDAANQIANGTIDDHTLAIVLDRVRNKLSLDSSWNISLFHRVGDTIAVVVRKYTDSTFSVLDTSVVEYYVLEISAVTLSILSSIQLS